MAETVFASCPVCGMSVHVTARGVWRTHGPTANRCPASGRPATMVAERAPVVRRPRRTGSLGRPRTTVVINPWALREFRERAGLTAAECARRIGVSVPVYSHFEAGDRRPRPDVLDRLAATLGVHVAALRATVCGPDCPCRGWQPGQPVPKETP